jgi:hypothetical protein
MLTVLFRHMVIDYLLPDGMPWRLLCFHFVLNAASIRLPGDEAVT